MAIKTRVTDRLAVTGGRNRRAQDREWELDEELPESDRAIRRHNNRRLDSIARRELAGFEYRRLGQHQPRGIALRQGGILNGEPVDAPAVHFLKISGCTGCVRTTGMRGHVFDRHPGASPDRAPKQQGHRDDCQAEL